MIITEFIVPLENLVLLLLKFNTVITCLLKIYVWSWILGCICFFDGFINGSEMDLMKRGMGHCDLLLLLFQAKQMDVVKRGMVMVT